MNALNNTKKVFHLGVLHSGHVLNEKRKVIKNEKNIFTKSKIKKKIEKHVLKSLLV